MPTGRRRTSTFFFKTRFVLPSVFLLGFLCGRYSTFRSWYSEQNNFNEGFLLDSGNLDHFSLVEKELIGSNINNIENRNMGITGNKWPNPIIVVGFPKAGTSSIAEYFRCGSIQKVAHHRCPDRACGAIIKRNIDAGRSPLRNTGKNDVYVQIDVELNVEKGLPCYFPQIEALNEIHRAHPNSTFLLNIRNVNSWIKSIRDWASMDRRLIVCNITGLPVGVGGKDEELRSFFLGQLERIRRFTNKFPSHRLVTVPIDSPNAGTILQDAFGIDKSCWGHHNKKSKEIP